MDKLFAKYLKTGGEFEIRFGDFGKTFTPGVKKDQFDRVFEFVSSNKKFYTHTVHVQKIEYFGDVRKITDENGTVFNKKTKSKENNVDVKDWFFRASLAQESKVDPIKNKQPDSVKHRTRHSFTNEKAKTRFDLDLSGNPDGTTNYSIELECLDGCTFDQLNKDITLTLKMIQETNVPLSKSQITDVIKYYNNITKTRKFIGVQPETLSIEKYKKKENYAVTKKLDGRRYLLLFFNGFLYAISSKFEVKWAGYGYSDKEYNGYIFDTEYYKGYYHIFDFVFPDSGILKERLDKVYNTIQNVKPLEGNKKLTIKHIVFTKNQEELYNAFIKESTNLDYKTYDGLILVKQDTNYKNSQPLKWKPGEMNTVDFQIEKNKDYTFDLYVCSKNELHLFTSTQVNKETFNFYENKSIVEFSFDSMTWKPLKYRMDKTKPNYITVAQDNLNSVLKPFIPEEAFNQNVALFNMRRFHNYVKRIYIDKYKGKTVLDLAVGKGGDLGKYNSSGFSYIEGYDINSKSIKEAISRASTMSNKSNSNISVKLNTLDLSKNIIPEPKSKFDLVVSNFAFHYFYETLDVYLKTVKNNLKKGGHLLLTFFDGSKIDNIKTKNYEIKKINKKQISVWIKDSVLNKPEIEFIVDVDHVVDLFEKNGLELVEKTDFEDFYKKWTKSSNKLSDEEKRMSFLNVALVFKLKK
jgi:ubiquinone/menaquinone biosynthesis C-methylase UbiE